MKRVALVAGVVVLGAVLGAGAVLALDGARDGGSSTVAISDPPEAADPAVRSDPVLLVWTSGGLPPDLAARVGDLASATRTTEVRGDLVEMIDPDAPDGFVVPLDALSIDASSYASFLPKGAAETVAELAPGEAVLGTTSAQLRDARPGSIIRLATGEQVRVAAILDDALVGAAELVVPHGTLAAIDTPRFLLVAYDGPREAIERAIRELLPPGEPVRFRAPGETPLLRHGDAVLPQAAVKVHFGEFSYRRTGERLELDPAWVREHVVEADVPIIGVVRCHRAIVDELRAVLLELEQRNLAYLVAPDQYEGCFVPRLISPDGGVSRHAWGVALDVNWAKNRQGETGTQDTRLIDAMTAHGFTWSGPWLVPDPAHFEWVRV